MSWGSSSRRGTPLEEPVSNLTHDLNRQLVRAVATGKPSEELAVLFAELPIAAVGVRRPANHQDHDIGARMRDVRLEHVERLVFAAGDPLELAEFQFLNTLAARAARRLDPHGHVVSIPGFGAFGEWLIETRATLARDPSRRCKPDFSLSKRFYEQVRKSASAARCAKGKLIRHRSNHSLRSMTTGSREVPVMTRNEFIDSKARQMA